MKAFSLQRGSPTVGLEIKKKKKLRSSRWFKTSIPHIKFKCSDTESLVEVFLNYMTPLRYVSEPNIGN